MNKKTKERKVKSVLKNRKGITLIALVVTIVVLLVLAGVSINLVIGNNGIISKVREAREQTKISQEKEWVDLSYLSVKASKDDNSIVTAQELEEQMNKEIGKGKVEVIRKDNILTVKYLDTDRIYEIEDNGEIDWNNIIKNAKRHKEQDPLNLDIGIGTDGTPVNLNLWNYYLENEKIYLGRYTTEGYAVKNYEVGYIGEIINGEIQGVMPQYIKIEGIAYPVTYLHQTFFGNTDIKNPPILPTTITEMVGTFADCTALKKAPIIPNSVIYMGTPASYNSSYTGGVFSNCVNLNGKIIIPENVKNIAHMFYGCTNLNATITINTNLEDSAAFYYKCFESAATSEDANVTVTGTSNKLDDIISTKSENSNVHR